MLYRISSAMLVSFTEKGRVTVNVRHLPEADMFELKVTDTGIEIPKEKVLHFRYEQVDSSATPEVWRCRARTFHCEEIY